MNHIRVVNDHSWYNKYYYNIFIYLCFFLEMIIHEHSYFLYTLQTFPFDLSLYLYQIMLVIKLIFFHFYLYFTICVSIDMGCPSINFLFLIPFPIAIVSSLTSTCQFHETMMSQVNTKIVSGQPWDTRSYLYPHVSSHLKTFPCLPAFLLPTNIGYVICQSSHVRPIFFSFHFPNFRWFLYLM